MTVITGAATVPGDLLSARAPRNLVATVDAARKVTVTWDVPAAGTPTLYEVHEFNVHPDATLKATVTPPARTRTSGVLNPGKLEYAVLAVDADGRRSRFSNTVQVVVITSGGTVAAGRAPGWDQPSAGGTPVGTAVFPMDLMPDCWNLTLPIRDPKNGSKVYEITKNGNPDLDVWPANSSTEGYEWFHLNDARTAIVMTSYFEGATTPNSTNTRSELREMTVDGLGHAKWSTASGRHRCTIVTQVDRLDGNHCVIGQIHGAHDDVTVFRLEGSRLWITDGNTAHGHLVTDNYVLGTRITIEFDVHGGICDFRFNGAKVWSLAISDSGCYFKAGNYLQRKGGAGSRTVVQLYSATVVHS